MNKINQYRKEKGMTQEELAKKMNVVVSCIANWEKEYRNPNVKQALKLAEILETTVEELYK